MKSFTFVENIIYWNRKFHIYIGLFLLFFIWLFSFSGLLLNNSHWKFAGFWEQRKESVIYTSITFPASLDSSTLIFSIMEQLKISGEVSNVRLTPESIAFRVMIPGTVREIHVDFKKKVSMQKVMIYNLWGKMRTIHSFNGLNKNNPEFRPNWVITKIWLLAMDAIAIGLIFLCISSWIMWYEVRKKYTFGLYLLVQGFAVAIYFVFLIRLF